MNAITKPADGILVCGHIYDWMANNKPSDTLLPDTLTPFHRCGNELVQILCNDCYQNQYEKE